jgi:PKD repeat protein
MGAGRLRFGVAIIAVIAIVMALLTAITVGSPAAVADTAPPDNGTPTTVSADVLETTQINGVVWDQVIVGDTVYATGEFTSARPAGAAAGTSETTRSNIVAYSLSTGEMVSSWAPSLNAQGLAITASTDGSTIFVAGDFTNVSGTTRYRIAALDASTGAVLPTFAPAFDARVRALTVVGDTLYIGGIFTSASGQARTRLAAVSTTNGAVLSWAPQANAEVMALTAPTGTNKIIAGGRFSTLNGTTALGSGALDATTGTTLAWPANTVASNSGTNAAITSLTSDGTQVYGTGYTFGSGGNLEGTFAASSVTGQITWINGCLGDSYGAAAVGNVLYTVSHAHDCGMIMGHPQESPWTYQRAQATTTYAAPDGRVNTYGNFSGVRASQLLHWLPSLAAGSYTGQTQAAWTVTTSENYIVLGGEFPKINGTAQQGLARFAISNLAGNTQGPRGYSDLGLSLDGIDSGTVRASFTAAWDMDNEQLTYELLRGAQLGTATVVSSRTARTNWWTRPELALVDPTAPGGTTQSYRLRVSDAFGNNFISPTLTVSVPAGTGSTFGDYSHAVLSDGATNYWRLGESSGTTGYNWAADNDLSVSSSATRGVAGAIVGDSDTATSFPGSVWGVPAASADRGSGPQVFTEEVWFQTTTTSGGKILGFGSSRTFSSSSFDRHIYMTDDGRLVFGVYSGGAHIAASSKSYNDGDWHQATAQLGPGGLRLFVDGELVATNTNTTSAENTTGYWRVGGDRISGWPGAPSSSNFAGRIDEVAIYPNELTPAQIQSHYQIGRGQVTNEAPTASFTIANSGMTLSVDGSASTDADGSVASYAWDFGDGTTGTGATASHTYAAAGTYTVTLTVTDDDGATGTSTQQVSVSESADLATDTFSRTVSTGFGTADQGGTWTSLTGGASGSVDGTTAVMTVPAGRSGTSTLSGVSSNSTDVTHTYTVNQAITGGGLYLGTIGRSTGAGDYRVRAKITSTGEVQLMAGRMVDGSNTVLGSRVTIADLTYTPGMTLHIRVQVTGTNPTTIRGRIWADGTPEPNTWQVSATDTTAGLQTTGSIGTYAYLSGSATNPVTIDIDNLDATAI